MCFERLQIMEVAFTKTRVVLFNLFISVMLVGHMQTVQAGAGESNFKTACAACHTIGKGRLVGPDLSGVDKRRTEAWLIKFIKSSQSLVKSGDPDAVAVYNKFFKIAMPDQPFSNAQIKEIISYISSVGGQASNTASVDEAPSDTEESVAAEPDAAIVALGADLFQGKVRLKNGGAACNSCHDVKNDAVIGGGILAKELTSSFSSMGGVGVKAILGAPPFPVMEAAYKNKEILVDEIKALVAFLQHADSKKAYQQPRDYGVGLVIAGLIGTLILLGLYSVIWSGRKKGSVNQAIYDRQKIVSSTEVR